MTYAQQHNPGLDAFAAQFQAQIDNAGPPGSEHAVHFCLALGFQAAYDLSPGSVVFERPMPGGRIDLWIIPSDTLIEVKYRRPIPSGRSLPATQIYGSLLADFNKVMLVDATQRLVVFVTDQRGASYLSRSGRGLLPMTVGSSTTIDVAAIASLPVTASRTAVDDGPWQPLSTTLIWQSTIADWSLLAWRVEPVRSS